jgi:hypothetical protein
VKWHVPSGLRMCKRMRRISFIIQLGILVEQDADLVRRVREIVSVGFAAFDPLAVQRYARVSYECPKSA